MARFPKIQRSCPVKNSLAEYMDGDVCRLCERQVFDLNGMTDDERQAFIASCTDEVCVSYKIPLRGLAAAAALGAAAVSMPAAAQDTLIELGSTQAGYEELEKCVEEYQLIEIWVGGIKEPAKVEYIDTEEDLEIPELPVTYEEVSGSTASLSTTSTDFSEELDAPQMPATYEDD